MAEPIKPEPSPTSPVGTPSGVVVQTGTVTATTAPDSKVTKVIVAVHGVGDQHTYATIQSVVNQFGRFYGEPMTVPLGGFHVKDAAAYSPRPPFSVAQVEHLAFAEVYWATVPRKAINDKYTLEEAKDWASTIVERLRLRWKQSRNRYAKVKDGKVKDVCTDADFDLLKEVLTEMIQTIAVLERLCYLSERAGLFTFDLRKLLDDYIGDVQVVAEFEEHRLEILNTFDALMKKVNVAYPKAEVFLVAHSEGTVVSFLGLLQAVRKPEQAAWINKVRGLMTFGSPIDKHLILWPELFTPAASDPPDPPTWRPAAPIEWRNYYDRGDPIGFELDHARVWLKRNGWDGVFNFDDQHDFGFTRYPFPGKAHVDYWGDEEVFGHFIQTVVNQPPPASATTPATGSPGPAPAAKAAAAEPARTFGKPGDIRWNKWLSYVLPYVGVAALLLVAAFILYKPFIRCIAPKSEAAQSTPSILGNVAALAILLLGVTIAARIPRLTRLWYWRLGAWIAYVLLAVVYLQIVPPGGVGDAEMRAWIEKHLEVMLPVGGSRLILATFVVGLAYWLGTKRPTWGLKPLIVLGSATVAGVLGYYLYRARFLVVPPGDLGPVWPVVLGTAGFVYLWWLAALIFDLSFVWHVYIRQSRALTRMNEMVGWSAEKEPAAVIGAARAG